MQAHSDEATCSAQLLQDFTLSSSGEHSCDFFHPAQPQPSGMEQLNVAAIVAQAQHLQGWCAQLELQLQAKDIGASPALLHNFILAWASLPWGAGLVPPGSTKLCVVSIWCSLRWGLPSYTAAISAGSTHL